ncbi:hypothetical protein D5085_14200 [Ectothiorhodospiraceae bacterium BW-2]|nr:hypothetical protein D5085_14200 [Ectothiorhodospiraceae bacterium BW-2]
MLTRGPMAGAVLFAALINLGGCQSAADDSTVNDSQLASAPSQSIVKGPSHWSGKVSYTDRLYHSTALTKEERQRPLQGVSLELLDTQLQPIATTQSDKNGHFSLTVDSHSHSSVSRIRFKATAITEGGYQLNLYNNGQQLYRHDHYLNDSTGDSEIELRFDDPSLAGGMNMLDVLTQAMQFLAAHRPDKPALPPLDIYWQAGESRGTYFCDEYDGIDCVNGPGMYVSDSRSDSDSYDDDVLWHEFGHYIEYALGISDSPGGYHFVTDEALDLRLSWSEGYASYVMAAIKQWLVAQTPEALSTTAHNRVTNYVDTRLFNGWSFDFANRDQGLCSGGDDCYLYASNEVAVSQILWQLDQAYGTEQLWPLIDQALPAAKAKGEWIHLERLWEAALARFGEPERPTLEAIFAERWVFMQPDAFESDNTLDATLPLNDCRDTAVNQTCLSQAHTLYGEGDIDVVRLQLADHRTYRIETFDLRNGADTLITLYSEGGGELLEDDDNDNRNYVTSPPDQLNDGSNLRSGLTFTPNRSGLFYVSVQSSPEQATLAPFAGKYGSYRLRVSVVR